MKQPTSKYVVYRHVITGSYPVFDTNDKKAAIQFIKSIRYQIIKKSPMDSGYFLVVKRQLRIQNAELLNWVKEQKQADTFTPEEQKKIVLLAAGLACLLVAVGVLLFR